LTVVSILAVTLIEVLLVDLLTNLKAKYEQVSISEAREEVEKPKSFEERYNLFLCYTGEDFPKTVQQISKPFWNHWEYVRKKRNIFVHGSPYALGWEVCKRAFKLASESVGIFAKLNNQFLFKK
jgi:hypothetical protein